MRAPRQSPVWEVAPADLAAAMARLAGDAGLLRRVTCAAPGELAARQHAFALHARRLLLREPPPRVLSLYAGPHPTGAYRRAETFRSDALRRLGYEVRFRGGPTRRASEAGLSDPAGALRRALDPPTTRRVSQPPRALPPGRWLTRRTGTRGSRCVPPPLPPLVLIGHAASLTPY